MQRLSGKQLRRLLGDPLHAGTAGHQRIDAAAFDAGLGRALHMAAMVADQGAAEAVLHEPGRAVRAFVAMGAGPAEGERRIAAPVEEEQRLLAARRPSPPRR